jgi:hypothetical protein
MAMKRMCLLGVLGGVGGPYSAVLGPYFDTFYLDYPMHQRFAQCGGVALKPTE